MRFTFAGKDYDSIEDFIRSKDIHKFKAVDDQGHTMPNYELFWRMFEEMLQNEKEELDD